MPVGARSKSVVARVATVLTPVASSLRTCERFNPATRTRLSSSRQRCSHTSFQRQTPQCSTGSG